MIEAIVSIVAIVAFAAMAYFLWPGK